ncbi:hypothetical protein LX99_04512 [Mucilaginibacter oryzae]|uniref:Uncharacterized protein n=1 Tax=Mucilaginibacter oryzae TaxID=468058 RepID=A0A316H019_9SPHI|nr:hypothetical protein [Mucilaginibacter oryzae]PWK71488.1 hypothetical protein LX99_04512 [Mucilaginibacter oryzae]
MPVGERQRLITKILSVVLDEPAQVDVKFNWFINQHQIEHFKSSFQIIDKIYIDLKGNNLVKKVQSLQSDAYFGGRYNFLFEFDEIQHFSSARLKSLNNYPPTLKVNYSIADWKNWCVTYSSKADTYRFNKTTKDFDFKGGRTCQRAYLDCFRDILPQHNGLNPTLRIADFEVKGIFTFDSNSVNKVKKLIEKKMIFL